MSRASCTVAGCDRQQANAVRGLCGPHDKRFKKYGDARPEVPIRARGKGIEATLRQYFTEGPEDSCWEWTGYKIKTGYGAVSPSSRFGTRMAHRAVYMLLRGPIPEGLELDHTCRNRGCCNPKHLEPVTHLENVRRGSSASKTHCVHGHEYTAENTRLSRHGHRSCKTCAGARVAKPRPYTMNREPGPSSVPGERSGSNKLTEKQVREIYALYHEAGLTQRSIAEMFDISKEQVGGITRGHSWRHLGLWRADA